VSDPFESAKFSIKLARRHYSNFDRLAAKYIKGEPYTVTTDFNALSGLHDVKIKIVRKLPENLRGFASDAIKNIRDALDQAMYAAVVVVTGKRNPRQAHFPFGDSEADLENSLWTTEDKRLKARKTPMCKDIPEELFPAVRAIKPYPHAGDQWALKTLQKISGPHKHGVSLTLGSASAIPFTVMKMSGTSEDGSPFTTSAQFEQWDATEKEFKIATVRGLPIGSKMIFGSPFHIAFNHPELKRFNAVELIQRWGSRTDVIISGLEKVAAQIVAERGG
jgi:hypothetical protein